MHENTVNKEDTIQALYLAKILNKLDTIFGHFQILIGTLHHMGTMNKADTTWALYLAKILKEMDTILEQHKVPI